MAGSVLISFAADAGHRPIACPCHKMNRKEFATVVRATVREFGRDDVGNMAAALTYYAFFSLFPLLILAVTLASLFLDPEEARRLIFSNANQVFPGSRQLLADALEAALKSRGSAGILAVIGLVALAFSASGAFDALDKAINRAWKTEKMPSFLIAKVVSFLMMLALAAVLLISVVVSTILTAGRAVTSNLLGHVPGEDVFWQATTFAATLAIAFLVFIFMYRFLPRSDVSFRDVWLGAFSAALVWSLLKEGFAYYLGSSFANYDAVYGTLGAVVALLTWIYLSSLIILAGAEFTAETARVRRLRAKATLEPGPQSASVGSPWLPERDT